jgi:ribosomal protein L29
MKVSEIRDLGTNELSAAISDARKEIVELRFKFACRKLESPAKLRSARKHLSRLLTVQTEKNRK